MLYLLYTISYKWSNLTYILTLHVVIVIYHQLQMVYSYKMHTGMLYDWTVGIYHQQQSCLTFQVYNSTIAYKKASFYIISA